MHKNMLMSYVRNGIIVDKISTALKDIKRIYVETAPLIYYVEVNSSYIDHQ
jgi:hypothetical protein